MMGISSNFIKALKNTLENSEYCVSLNNCCSDPFPVNIGVKQGDILSPLLFSLFTTDLPEYLDYYDNIIIGDTPQNIIMYADDLVLITKTPSSMQTMLDKLHEYCTLTNLTVNVNKTKSMTICNKTHQPITFKYNNEQIDYVKNFKYLGIIIDQKYTLKPLIGSIITKSKASIANLFSSFQIPLKAVSASQIKKLFDAKVLSIISYSAIIWGSLTFNDIEKIQIYFYKRIFKLPNFSPTLLVKCIFGLLSIHSFTIISVFRYFIKLNQTRNPILANCLRFYINLNNQQDGRNKTTYSWLTELKDGLTKFGLNPQGLIDSINRIPNQLLLEAIKKEINKYEKDYLNKEILSRYPDPIISSIPFNHYSSISKIDLPYDLKCSLIMFLCNTSLKMYTSSEYISCFHCKQTILTNTLSFHIIFECPCCLRPFYNDESPSLDSLHKHIKNKILSNDTIFLQKFTCFIKYNRKKMLKHYC